MTVQRLLLTVNYYGATLRERAKGAMMMHHAYRLVGALATAEAKCSDALAILGDRMPKAVKALEAQHRKKHG